ncbi:MAG: hypothetical protein R3E64_09345 [Halioglobus sp.]
MSTQSQTSPAGVPSPICYNRRRKNMPVNCPRTYALCVALLCLPLLACQGKSPSDTTQGAQGNTPATETTIAANAGVRESLNLADQQDFDDASRGLIAAPAALIVAGPNQSKVWDMPSYDFIKG